MSPRENIDRKGNEAPEYVHATNADGVRALLTPREWAEAVRRAEKNPEDFEPRPDPQPEPEPPVEPEPEEPTPEPQPAPWATGRWSLTVDGRPGLIDFRVGTVSMPQFGTLEADIETDGDAAAVSFSLGTHGTGRMALSHEGGRLTGTATAAGQTVSVTGQREAENPTPQPEPEEPGEPLPPAPDGFPNLPSGFATIGHADGSVKESGGHAFGIGSFGGWSSTGRNISVVDDPASRSGKALEFVYKPGEASSGVATAQRFEGGPYSAIYLAFRIKHVSGWSGFGNKFFYLGAASGNRRNSGGPTQFYATREASQKVRVINQNGGSTVLIDSSDPPPRGGKTNPIAIGRWQIAEFLFADGQVRAWVDGTLIGTGSLAGPFDGMEWYAKANASPVESRYRLGELYIAGRK